MTSHPLLALHHTHTQLLYRWLSPEPFLGIEYLLPEHYPTLTLTQWEEFAQTYHQCLDLENPRFSYRQIAQATYEHIQRLYAQDGKLLLINDPLYPPLLREIPDPPVALSVLGDSNVLNKNSVAIIGSRKASLFALQEAFGLGKEFACANVAVVSGGAIGCDIAAHKGVLDANPSEQQNAIVVFAGGLGNLYPRANHASFRALRSSGALLISERLWQQSARAFDFPVRNRIISGLTNFIFIMQAEQKSGAMTTARCALDQGREVFVLIHPDSNTEYAYGNQILLEEGALGFTSAKNFFVEYCEKDFVFG